MSYVGNTPTQQAFTPAVDYFNGTGSQTAFTLSRPVASVAQVEVIVNNVAQNPGSTYTVSGNTITFSSAPSAGTNNVYVRYTSPITQVATLTQAPSVLGPMAVSINGATPLGGATNPILGASGSANSYVQLYTYNLTNGANSSADFTAYPSNGNDAAGWVDMGITSLAFNQSAYSVTGPNESYLFGSAPSGSGTTGNLVIATDSTGTTNNIQFYPGGFTQAKNAYAAQVTSGGITMGSAKGITFNPTTYNAGRSSNTLNDYEEGGWTPAFGGNSVAGSCTYSIQSGRYTKIGRVVFAMFDLQATSALSGASGVLAVRNLPFTVLSTAGTLEVGAGSCGYFAGYTGGAYTMNLYVDSGNTNIIVTFGNNGTAIAYGSVGNIANGTRIQGSITYIAST